MAPDTMNDTVGELAASRQKQISIPPEWPRRDPVQFSISSPPIVSASINNLPKYPVDVYLLSSSPSTSVAAPATIPNDSSVILMDALSGSPTSSPVSSAVALTSVAVVSGPALALDVEHMTKTRRATREAMENREEKENGNQKEELPAVADITIVATPLPKGKGKGHSDISGRLRTPIGRILGAIGTPIQVRNVRVAGNSPPTLVSGSGNPDKSPFIGPGSTSNGRPQNAPMASTPRRNGREVGLPGSAARHLQAARDYAKKLKRKPSPLKVTEDDRKPATPDFDGERSQDSIGLNTFIRRHDADYQKVEEEIQKLDKRLEKATPAESPKHVEDVPTVTVSPPPASPPPAPSPPTPSSVKSYTVTAPALRAGTGRPLAAKRGSNRFTSIIQSMSGGSSISVITPESRTVVPIPIISPPTVEPVAARKDNSPAPTPAPAPAATATAIPAEPLSARALAEKYARLVVGPVDMSKAMTKDRIRIMRMFAPIEEKIQIQCHMINPRASGRDVLIYMGHILVEERVELIVKHLEPHLKVAPELGEDVAMAIIKDLEKKGTVTPEIERMYAMFEREREEGKATKDWCAVYREVMEVKAKAAEEEKNKKLKEEEEARVKAEKANAKPVLVKMPKIAMTKATLKRQENIKRKTKPLSPSSSPTPVASRGSTLASTPVSARRTSVAPHPASTASPATSTASHPTPTATNRLSIGAFGTKEAREERKNEKSKAPAPPVRKLASSPVQKPTNGVRVPASRRPSSVGKSSPGASSSKPPPPQPPPRPTLSPVIFKAACGMLKGQASAKSPTQGWESSKEQDRRTMKILSPEEESLRADFTRDMQNGGTKSYVQYLRNYLAQLREDAMIEGIERWYLPDHPDATANDIASFIQQTYGGLEGFQAHARPAVESFFDDFDAACPHGTAAQWKEYRDARWAEDQITEEEIKERKAREAAIPIVGVEKRRMSLRPNSTQRNGANVARNSLSRTPPTTTGSPQSRSSMAGKTATATKPIPTPRTSTPLARVAGSVKSSVNKENVRPTGLPAAGSQTAQKVFGGVKRVFGEKGGNVPAPKAGVARLTNKPSSASTSSASTNADIVPPAPTRRAPASVIRSPVLAPVRAGRR